MSCQACGAQAPTKFVTFYQNIGAVIMRFNRKIQGNLCKSCITKNFWKMTLTTLAIGWLGMISLVIAPIYIIANIVQYLRCLSLPSAHSSVAQGMPTEAPPPPQASGPE